MNNEFPNTSLLVFDIETVADLEGARRVYPELSQLNDDDTLAALTSLRIQEAGHDFMRLPLHRIVCISALYIKEGNFSLFSLTADTMSEQEIISTFFRAFKDINNLPQLVSWNGSGFDIPVLIYRAMQYDVTVPLLFEQGDRINNMRFNNYVNRFHTRHLDLMDRFSQYGGSRHESMDVVATLYGFPGKTCITGNMVGELARNDEWDKVSIYCESDVLNTWLIYLRWQRLTGKISSSDYDAWVAQTRDFLSTKTEADGAIRHHLFLENWQSK